MKTTITILLLVFLISCDNKQEKSIEDQGSKLDVNKELASIEETRQNFENAIKEKRYEDLQNYSTKDLITLTPICGDWEEYKNLKKNPTGAFSYDSIHMQPEETIVLNDSMAYDFGISTVYYTNTDAEVVDIKASFLAILKKDKTDGVWKLHREVATTNMK